MLAWMSADDPPFYARNDMPDAPVDLDNPSMNLVHHHPLHIKALKARVEETGLKGAYLHAPALKIVPSREVRADFVPFMVGHLKSAKGGE